MRNAQITQMPRVPAGTTLATVVVMRAGYDDLNERTKAFAVRMLVFARHIESLPVTRWLTKQLVSSATSVAANQRAARRARSARELASKLSIIVEEADESLFWCELLLELPLPETLISELRALTDEARQLVAIFSKGRA